MIFKQNYKQFIINLSQQESYTKCGINLRNVCNCRTMINLGNFLSACKDLRVTCKDLQVTEYQYKKFVAYSVQISFTPKSKFLTFLRSICTKVQTEVQYYQLLSSFYGFSIIFLSVQVMVNYLIHEQFSLQNQQEGTS